MKTLTIDEVNPKNITDTYDTCKYLERQGISLEAVTIGNAHQIIEEIVDEFRLPVTQIINPDNVVEGYHIGA